MGHYYEVRTYPTVEAFHERRFEVHDTGISTAREATRVAKKALSECAVSKVIGYSGEGIFYTEVYGEEV